MTWKTENGMSVIYITEDGATKIFGDPLPKQEDGFHLHDCYHCIMSEDLKYSEVLSNLLDGQPLKRRLVLQEEAVVLNDFLRGAGNAMWSAEMLSSRLRQFTPLEVLRCLGRAREMFKRLHALERSGWTPTAKFTLRHGLYVPEKANIQRPRYRMRR